MRKNSQFFDQYDYQTGLYGNLTLPELRLQAKRNLQALIELINRLFQWHSRLLVVRVDLKYRKAVANDVPIEVAQMHREQLLSDRREHPVIFEGLLGYAWGLEYGEHGSGLHYHLLAFYDGSKRQEDITIGLAIGSHWEKITNGYGYANVSNTQKDRLAMSGLLGIGMIHRDDVPTRINLIERVAAYITKKPYAWNVESGRTESGEFRTFGRSWMPQPFNPDVPRRGRPPM